MANIGLIVTINKYKNHFASSTSTIVCSTIEEAKLELIKFLVAHFSLLNIDFPMEYNDFEFIWFNEMYVGTNAFTYRLYHDNKWSEPWTHQEIYDDVLEAMYVAMIANPPDFDTMYGEPKYNDEEEEHIEQEKEIDTFTTTNQSMLEVEDQMKKIMKEAESVHIIENCNCNQCNNIKELKELNEFITNES
jgi:hypothetical protein